MSHFEPHPGTDPQIEAMAIATMEEIDSTLRSELVGEPADAVETRAREAFEAANLDMNDDFYTEYALSVSEDRPYSFE